MRRNWRLIRVNLIVLLWPIMPRRWRVWAFMNDDMPEGE